MKTICLIILTLTVCIGCTRQEPPPAPPPELTTVECRMERPWTFEITGTGVKGIELAELGEALREHQMAHPGNQYEVLAEFKMENECAREIAEVFREAGVGLVHFWVGVNTPSWDAPGPYGPGMLDLMPEIKPPDNQ